MVVVMVFSFSFFSSLRKLKPLQNQQKGISKISACDDHSPGGLHHLFNVSITRGIFKIFL